MGVTDSKFKCDYCSHYDYTVFKIKSRGKYDSFNMCGVCLMNKNNKIFLGFNCTKCKKKVDKIYREYTNDRDFRQLCYCCLTEEK